MNPLLLVLVLLASPSATAASTLNTADILSKMTPTIQDIHRSSTNGPKSSELPVFPPNVSPTPLSRTSQIFSFTPTVRAEDNAISFSDGAVECNSVADSNAAIRSIEIPYYYQTETPHDTVDELLLTALAHSVLTCGNEENEEIRRSLRVGSQQGHVVSISSAHLATAQPSDACQNSNAQSCHLVEGKLTMIIRGGDEAEDDGIVTKAYTTVRLAFIALEQQSQSTFHLSYIGKGPVTLNSVDKLSKKSYMGTTDNDRSLFGTIFIAMSICGLVVTIGSLLTCLCIGYADKREKRSPNNDAWNSGSTGVPSTIEISVSSSAEDREKDPQAIPIEEKDGWCRFVASVALSNSTTLQRVPEETSVGFDDDEFEDISI